MTWWKFWRGNDGDENEPECPVCGEVPLDYVEYDDIRTWPPYKVADHFRHWSLMGSLATVTEYILRNLPDG